MKLKEVTLHESTLGPSLKGARGRMQDSWKNQPDKSLGYSVDIDRKVFPMGVILTSNRPGDNELVLIPWTNIKGAIYDNAWALKAEEVAAKRIKGEEKAAAEAQARAEEAERLRVEELEKQQEAQA